MARAAQPAQAMARARRRRRARTRLIPSSARARRYLAALEVPNPWAGCPIRAMFGHLRLRVCVGRECHMQRLRLILPMVLALLFLIVPGATAADMPAVPTSAMPAHFALGISAGPGDTWMPESGVPWDYAYQYLAGGVNTGSGWRTWNDNAQFPLWYAQGAAKNHYVPVFSYYMLLQSNGPCGGCGEAEKDLAHLGDPPTMAAYYADFATLMHRLGPGSYGGPVIVQV